MLIRTNRPKSICLKSADYLISFLFRNMIINNDDLFNRKKRKQFIFCDGIR